MSFLTSLFLKVLWGAVLFFIIVLVSYFIWKLAQSWVRDFSRLFADLVNNCYERLVNNIRRLLTNPFIIVVSRQRPAFKRRVKPLFRIKAIEAERAVKDRHRFIVENTEGMMPIEVLELPPGFENEKLGVEVLSNEHAIAQYVRLRWQLTSEKYLLFGRVLDSLVAILRRAGELSMSSDQKFLKGGTLDLSLRRLKPKEISPGDLPWTVVVGTNKPKIIVEGLLEIKSWLGIGIDIATPLKFKMHRTCKKSPDINGTIAGLLMLRNCKEVKAEPHCKKHIFALTCAHVVPRCDCYAARGYFSDGSQPDAALLPVENCFIYDTSNLELRDTATASEIEQLSEQGVCEHGERGRIIRLGGFSRSYPGIIENPATTFPAEGEKKGEKVISKFPAFSVVLYKKYFFFGLIPWPFFRKLFSKGGDSGSWVISEEDGKWLGMLIGGSPRANLSYCLYGSELINHFDEELGNKFNQFLGGFIPFSLSYRR